MKLEDIEKEWNEDCPFDENNLFNEALRIPKLHSKYYGFYMREKVVLERQKLELEFLESLLWQFYTKKCDENTGEEILKKLGKKEFPEIRYVGKEAETVILANDQMLEAKKKVMFQSEKVEYLKAVIQTINNRSFMIKNAIDWKKFESGA